MNQEGLSHAQLSDDSDSEGVEVMVYSGLHSSNSGGDDSNSFTSESDTDGEADNRSGSLRNINRSSNNTNNRQRRVEFVSRRGNGGEDDEADPTLQVSSLVSRALASDLRAVTESATTGSAPLAKAQAPDAPKARECCVCGSTALYTCPCCGRRTCSMTCVRVHKTDHNCTGQGDVAVRVPLADFTDAQLQKDFAFLDNCRRIVDNAERGLPRMWRYTFRALPPPLHALREAARKRGVVCQITSEGMRKRDNNTSRFDRRSDTVIWHCEFNFHVAAPALGVSTLSKDFTVTTTWGSERHRLGDIARYCWATNPPLPCYHINRRYNNAARYLGDARKASNALAEEQGGEEGGEVLGGEEAPAQAGGKGVMKGSIEDPSGVEMDNNELEEVGVALLIETVVADTEPVLKDTDSIAGAEETGANAAMPSDTLSVVPATTVQVVAPAPVEVTPISPDEVRNEARVRAFFAGGEEVVVLSKAERLGSIRKYFKLDSAATLNENLRLLFFINEYPVLEVIHASDLGHYPLVTDEDKAAIRASFKATERPASQKRELRKRSDLEPEEQERLAKIPCRLFLAGRCGAGEECPFMHCSREEVPACHSFVRFGKCSKGERCSFSHDSAVVAAAAAARKRPRGGGGGSGRGGRQHNGSRGANNNNSGGRHHDNKDGSGSRYPLPPDESRYERRPYLRPPE